MTSNEQTIESTTMSGHGNDRLPPHGALLDWMGRLSWWKLLGIFAVLAEIATAAISALQTLIWWKCPLFDLFLLGAIDSGLVSLIVGGAFVTVLNELRVIERLARERQEQLVSELRTASETINALQGIIPICAWCKKVRDDVGYWQQVETYIQDHSDAHFSHGICPSCLKNQLSEDIGHGNELVDP